MKAPCVRFFPADWLIGVMRLTNAQRGVYIHLLMLIYENGAPIKADEHELARACALSTPAFRRAFSALIASNKFTITDGFVTNHRAKEECSERENYARTRRENAASGWQKRKGKQGKNKAHAMLEQSHTQSHTQFASLTEETARKRAFDRFWNVWPNRVGKPAAERSFAKVAGEVEAIIAGVAAYVRDKPADRPWLNPATFLNQRRWEDAPAALPQGGPNTIARPSFIRTLQELDLNEQRTDDELPYDLDLRVNSTAA